MSKDRSTELLNYMAAMSHEVGEFRQETNRQFGEVAARLDKVEQRLGGVEQRLGNIESEQRQSHQLLDRIV